VSKFPVIVDHNLTGSNNADIICGKHFPARNAENAVSSFMISRFIGINDSF